MLITDFMLVSDSCVAAAATEILLIRALLLLQLRFCCFRFEAVSLLLPTSFRKWCRRCVPLHSTPYPITSKTLFNFPFSFLC
jgi:hypothetical protein